MVEAQGDNPPRLRGWSTVRWSMHGTSRVGIAECSGGELREPETACLASQAVKQAVPLSAPQGVQTRSLLRRLVGYFSQYGEALQHPIP
jgi:hypothetical protein